MSLHLDAAPGSFSSGVVLPGDPLRAKVVAEQLLTEVSCVNQRRGALGYTGLLRGRRVSIQATGMGMPSIAIYAQELIVDYGVRRLVRLGTCGAIRPELKVGDVVLAMGASTDSSMNRRVFEGMDYAPVADFLLLHRAWELASEQRLPVHVGTVVTSDTFYSSPDSWRVWAEHGVLAAEMETSALYTVAARHAVGALSILTVSDVIGSREQVMPPEERERALLPAAALALELAAG